MKSGKLPFEAVLKINVTVGAIRHRRLQSRFNEVDHVEPFSLSSAAMHRA
jgi:hypothetical protein